MVWKSSWFVFIEVFGVFFLRFLKSKVISIGYLELFLFFLNIIIFFVGIVFSFSVFVGCVLMLFFLNWGMRRFLFVFVLSIY